MIEPSSAFYELLMYSLIFGVVVGLIASFLKTFSRVE